MNESVNKEDLAGVMRRVNKLLAIAGDDRANSAEAANAAAMAEKIMRKYQLDHEDIVRAEFKQKENFETVDACVVMKKGQAHKPEKVPPWASWLAVSCARLNDCEVRFAFTRELGACVRFFGYKADVQVCGWMFDYLTTVTIRNCRAFQKESFRTKAESNSYRSGFVMRVNSALQAAKDAKVAEQPKTTGTGLMVVKQQAVAEHFGEFTYGKAKEVKVSESSAFSRGRADGSRVDINRRGLGTNAGGSQLLLS